MPLLLTTALAQPIMDDAGKPFEGKPGALSGLVITIDPGHGGSAHQSGYSGSARGVNSRLVEGDYNMLVAAGLRHYLSDSGATVHITRLDDRKVVPGMSNRDEELGARPALAATKASHLFLSIHHNSFNKAEVEGVVVMLWPTDSKGADQPLEREFARVLKQEVSRTVPSSTDRSFIIDQHPLVSAQDVPSVIIEFGFLSNPGYDTWLSQRGNHRTEAIGAYNAVVRMWKENKDALIAERARLFPDAKPPREREWQRPTEERFDSGPVRDVAKDCWPFEEPPATKAEIESIISYYKLSALSDRTVFHLDINVDGDAQTGFILTGSASHRRNRLALEGILKLAGAKIAKYDVEQLPSKRLGERKFAVVQIPMALTWARPKEGETVQTQALLGERVYVLDVNEDASYHLISGSDSYLGWVRAEALRLMAEDEFAYWQDARTATFVRDTMADDYRIPLGASLPILEETPDAVTVLLPAITRGAGKSDRYTTARRNVRLQLAEKPGRLAAENVRSGEQRHGDFGGVTQSQQRRPRHRADEHHTAAYR